VTFLFVGLRYGLHANNQEWVINEKNNSKIYVD